MVLNATIAWWQSPGGDGSDYRVLTDPHEIMAFAARPTCRAVGAEGAAQGAVNGSVDVKSSFGFGELRPDHSGQFNRNIQQLQRFYQRLKEKLTP